MDEPSKNDNTSLSEANDKKDVEGEQKKMKYPKAVGFIVSNEFCERFNYYGMRTILVLYLTRKLFFDEDTATVLYHIFTSLVYFMSLFGAILADSWLGKYRTILYLSIVYVCGSVVIAIGAVPTLNLPATVFTIIGLLLIAIGSGGIKPCVIAFGGDQFQLPEQVKQLAIFFSLFYFAINAGSLISTSITPILREDVNCFDDEGCFSLAFGVPAVLMTVSILVFIGGKFLYKMKKPSGNMLVLVSKCIGNAISNRRKEKDTNPREHWLDYAAPTYGAKLVGEVRDVLKVLLLYIPLPIFWALFDQQGSRWTFQATRMDGRVGSFTIKPDQLQVINPLLILAFIPLYDVVFYPLLSKIGIRRPLQKLTLGGIFAGISFIISAIVELQLETTYPIMPSSNECQMRIFNSMSCDYRFQTQIDDYAFITVKSMALFEDKYITAKHNQSIPFRASAVSGACGDFDGEFKIVAGQAVSFLIKKENNNPNLLEFIDDPSKSRNGNPIVRLLVNTDTTRSIKLIDNDGTQRFKNDTNYIGLQNIPTSIYTIYLDEEKIDTVEFLLGGVYTVVINTDNNMKEKVKVHEITLSNSIHMLWLIPQYVIMTLGEVMYSVTGLEFSYSQAPSNMKSVLQAGWQLTIAIGNVVVAIVAEAKIFKSQASEFFLFAALMFADMAIFAVLAYRYVYVTPKKEGEDDGNSEETTKLEDSNGTMSKSDIDMNVHKTD